MHKLTWILICYGTVYAAVVSLLTESLLSWPPFLMGLLIGAAVLTVQWFTMLVTGTDKWSFVVSNIFLLTFYYGLWWFNHTHLNFKSSWGTDPIWSNGLPTLVGLKLFGLDGVLFLLCNFISNRMRRLVFG